MKPATLNLRTDIIEEHVEEVAFLWSVRDSAVLAANYNLPDIMELDNRLNAHFNGLRLSIDLAWPFCVGAINHGEAGEIFAAMVIASEDGDDGRMRAVLDAVCASPECSGGLISALGWLPSDVLNAQLTQLFSDGSPVLRRAAIAAQAIARQDPGPRLQESIVDDDPFLRARALRAAGELGRIDLLPLIQKEMMAEDEHVRFAACWSAALFGDMTAVAILKSFIASADYAEKAMDMALRGMPVGTAKEWLNELAENPDYIRLIVKGAGIVGEAAFIPGLIEAMATPALSRIAGNAFSTITGVDIVEANMEADAPTVAEGDTSGEPDETSEETDEQAMAIDPDEDLPWPNRDRVARWWEANQGQFQPGERYLLGKPLTVENLQHVLRFGYQPQRAAAALELALKQPGQPLFDTRAPAARQRRLLGL